MNRYDTNMWLYTPECLIFTGGQPSRHTDMWLCAMM